jgi:hypothetical protein
VVSGRDGLCAVRSRPPIFIATLWAVASWLFFGVARSLHIDPDMLAVTASPARTAWKNSQPTRQPPGETSVPLSALQLRYPASAARNIVSEEDPDREIRGREEV